MTDVYLELGTRRAFAVAVEWPGWARGGRNEDAALSALIDYGERYRLSVGATALDVPIDVAGLRVVERIAGDASTDFGAPGAIPPFDERTVDGDELERLIALHDAAWRAFERALAGAEGRSLAPAGPRGGGRPADKIAEHVVGAEHAYTRGIGGRPGEDVERGATREAFQAQLRERAAGNVPDVGPRGGRRWPVRYAVRRACWHLLDHAWEIEDRLAG